METRLVAAGLHNDVEVIAQAARGAKRALERGSPEALHAQLQVIRFRVQEAERALAQLGRRTATAVPPLP
jgi:hypothetical protein